MGEAFQCKSHWRGEERFVRHSYRRSVAGGSEKGKLWDG